MAIAAALQAQGFDVRGIRPPTVPAGTARLRIAITLNASEADIAGARRRRSSRPCAAGSLTWRAGPTRTAAPARCARGWASTKRRWRAGWRSTSRAFRARSTVEQFRGGQSNPTYRLATPASALCPAPQAARPAAPRRARRAARGAGAAGAGPHGLPGRADPWALRRRRGHRHAVLRHGPGRGPDLLGRALRGRAQAEQRHLFRCDERHHRPAARDRLRGDRARRLRQAGQLLRPPDRPLEPAICEDEAAGRDADMDALVEWLPTAIPEGDETASSTAISAATT